MGMESILFPSKRELRNRGAIAWKAVSWAGRARKSRALAAEIMSVRR